ncbi:uncharacterized protein LOC132306179 [Cornus florida]|uniref:uncharacterized protein LOC132306179 n=1 Tax=Cornus florida TaxID=4283 RepID=UPI00289E7B28|nr:uncharacterized protein LOC132306179 [Cornus florida]
MELWLQTLPLTSFSKNCYSKLQNAFERNSSFPFYVKSKEPRDRRSIISSALPETAASVAVAATVVGAAATFLVRRTKASEATEVPLQICEDCSGSGICSECNGEGFVLKKLSDKGAERARMTAKNMATRYTAGLPKKWSYCTKCSSARSCSSCGGSGKLSY